jgi:hypothetical protein
MGKKRTQQPYYGKLSQRLDHAAAQAAREGNLDAAKALRGKSREVENMRRKAAGAPLVK